MGIHFGEMQNLIRFCIPFEEIVSILGVTTSQRYEDTNIKVIPWMLKCARSQVNTPPIWEVAGGTQTNICCQAFYWTEEKHLMLKRHWVDGKAKEMSISKTKVYFKIQLSSLKLLKISAGYGDGCSWLCFWLLLNRMSQSSYRVNTVKILKRGTFGNKYFSSEGKTKKVGQKSWKWLHTGTRVFQTHQSEKWAIKSKLLRTFYTEEA